jgi:hypothetical protein
MLVVMNAQLGITCGRGTLRSASQIFATAPSHGQACPVVASETEYCVSYAPPPTKAVVND